MTDLIKLRKEIQRRGFCYSEIAKALNVTCSCISKKMKGTEEFEEIQITILAALLGLSEQEKEDIFFSNKALTPKSGEEIAYIAKDIINLLAEKNCTVADANNALRIAKMSIEDTAPVRKFGY